MSDGRIGNSNQVLQISGVVSAPAYSWASDNDTGFYRIGANNIGVAANGAKVLDIATTGLAVTGTLSSTSTITFPTPFTLGSTSVTTTGTQLNYLNAATGTTGTTSSNLVFSASPTITGTLSSADHVITSTSANALAVGRQGATNPVLNVDASTASVVTGLNIKGAAAAGGLALSVTSSGTNENLTVDAKGSGTITLGGTSTGAITLSRATTMSAAITYGGVTLSNAVTGTGNMVLSASPTLTGTLTAATITASAIVTLTSANGEPLRINGATTGQNALSLTNTGGSAYFGQENSTGNNLIIGSTAYDTIIRGPSGISFSANAGSNLHLRLTSTGLALPVALTYGGVTLSNSVTGTGSMVLSAGPTFTGTVTAPTVTASSQTIGTTASNPLIFNINGSEKARVGSDGSFLVGTATNGGWSAAAIAEFKTTLQYGSSFYQANNNGGYSASSFRLDYAGLLFAGFYHSTTQIGSITDVSGTSTAYNTTSDYRLKKNVRPMTGGLATISALKPVIYDWVKNDTLGEGFIAHELQAVIPIAVHGEKDAVTDDGSIRPQGVDFGKIVPHLVCALQELKAEFDAYKASHP